MTTWTNDELSRIGTAEELEIETRRGIIIFFPYMAYGIYSRIVPGICYTYREW